MNRDVLLLRASERLAGWCSSFTQKRRSHREEDSLVRCEQIRIDEETRRADEVVVPDIRFVGVIVGKNEQELLEYAYRSAIRVHLLIMSRERSRNVAKKRFEIDVPDLWFIIVKLRQHEEDELVRFHITFHSLVNHFLPNAQAECYTYDGKKLAGMRYMGMAWISK